MSYQQFGPNGFDFGLSAPKTGLGPGLLGDLKTLQALQTQMAGQNCDDCPPEEPCPSCRAAELGSGSDQGEIIKTQAPIPVPGLFPPPPIGLLPQQPSHSMIIGSPNAWWNWTPGEWADWTHGVFETRPPSRAAEKACEDQVNAELKRCEAVSRRATAEAGPDAGKRELDSCRRHSWQKYSDCLKNDGKPDMQPYPDWYGDEE